MTEREKLYSQLSRDDLVALWEEEKDSLGPVTLRALGVLCEDLGLSPTQVIKRGITRILFDEHPNQELISEVLG